MIGFILNMFAVALWIVLGAMTGQVFWLAIIINIVGGLFCLALDAVR